MREFIKEFFRNVTGHPAGFFRKQQAKKFLILTLFSNCSPVFHWIPKKGMLYCDRSGKRFFGQFVILLRRKEIYAQSTSHCALRRSSGGTSLRRGSARVCGAVPVWHERQRHERLAQKGLRRGRPAPRRHGGHSGLHPDADRHGRSDGYHHGRGDRPDKELHRHLRPLDRRPELHLALRLSLREGLYHQPHRGL